MPSAMPQLEQQVISTLATPPGEDKEKEVVESAVDEQKRIADELQAQADAEAEANQKANDAGKDEAEEETEEGATAASPDVAPAYAPSFKFKVLDKEHEFDPRLQAIIKDADTEKFVRELHEKAFGLDHVKPKVLEERAARETVERQFEAFQDEVKELASLKKHDLGMFFEKLGVTKQEVAKWVVQQAEIEEKPEHERHVYNELQELKRRQFELAKANAQLGHSRVAESTQARVGELQQVLADQSVAPLIQEFESRLGRAGAFTEMVIRHGKAEWETKQKDLSAKEAVDQVLQILNLKPAQTPSPVVTPNEPAPTVKQAAQVKVTKPHRPTVLPSVGGGNASSATKRVTSIDDIRKVYRQMTNQD